MPRLVDDASRTTHRLQFINPIVHLTAYIISEDFFRLAYMYSRRWIRFLQSSVGTGWRRQRAIDQRGMDRKLRAKDDAAYLGVIIYKPEQEAIFCKLHVFDRYMRSSISQASLSTNQSPLRESEVIKHHVETSMGPEYIGAIVERAEWSRLEEIFTERCEKAQRCTEVDPTQSHFVLPHLTLSKSVENRSRSKARKLQEEWFRKVRSLDQRCVSDGKASSNWYGDNPYLRGKWFANATTSAEPRDRIIATNLRDSIERPAPLKTGLIE